MKRRTAWMLAIWLPLAAAAPAEGPADLRQRILAALAGEVAPADLDAAEVVAGGELAAVRLPPEAEGGGIYLLERDPETAGAWRPAARITAPQEAHFGDSIILGSGTVLVAAPDTAGAGLGPGIAYVFQRNVGGSGRWGLVARLAPAPYPPAGAVTVRPLAPAADRPRGAAAAPPEPAGAPPPPVEAVGAPAPPAETVDADQERPAAMRSVEVAEAEPPQPPPDPGRNGAAEPPPEPAAGEDDPRAEPATPEPPEPAVGEQRFIVAANMSEKPRALRIAADLRAKGYPSAVYRNYRGFFVVTLARLPVDQARTLRDEAVSAGDVSPNAYLIVGSGFRERVDP